MEYTYFPSVSCAISQTASIFTYYWYTNMVTHQITLQISHTTVR